MIAQGTAIPEGAFVISLGAAEVTAIVMKGGDGVGNFGQAEFVVEFRIKSF